MLQLVGGPGETHPQVSLQPLALHARDSSLQRSEHSLIIWHAPRCAPAVWALSGKRCMRLPESSKVSRQQWERIGWRVGPVHERCHEVERALRCRHAARRNCSALVKVGGQPSPTPNAVSRRLARAHHKLNVHDSDACTVWRPTNAAWMKRCPVNGVLDSRRTIPSIEDGPRHHRSLTPRQTSPRRGGILMLLPGRSSHITS